MNAELQWAPVRRWAQCLSLLLATPLSLVLLIHPAAMVDSQGQYSHSLLMLVMVGIAAGFVHGVGFIPYNRFWKLLFSPYPGWPLMALGYGMLAAAQTA